MHRIQTIVTSNYVFWAFFCVHNFAFYPLARAEIDHFTLGAQIRDYPVYRPISVVKNASLTLSSRGDRMNAILAN